jgi:hypothetical protein
VESTIAGGAGTRGEAAGIISTTAGKAVANPVVADHAAGPHATSRVGPGISGAKPAWNKDKGY